MARIYVKPQVRSSRPARPPRAVDYNVIEQIANGIEKMVVQWNHAKEARIIRPYSRNSSNSSSNHHHQVAAAKPARSKQSDESVQAGSPQVRVDSTPGTNSSSLGGGDATTEMSIFVRGPGSLKEMVIPNLSGIVRAEVMKQQMTNGDQMINSSSAWYNLKSNSNNNKNAVAESIEKFESLLNPPCSSRTDDSVAVTTASEETGYSSMGFTPRLESAVERIQDLNSCSSNVQEMARQLRAGSQGGAMSAEVSVGNRTQLQQELITSSKMLGMLEHDQGEEETMNGSEELGSMSERTESACKESCVSEGTSPDDTAVTTAHVSTTTHVSSNQVDDWTETGDVNAGEIVSYSKKKHDAKEKEELLDDYKVKVEELQIALLECSTEYEVKIVEMKMMMLNMKSQYRQQMTTGNSNVKLVEPQPKEFAVVTTNQAKQTAEFIKKQMHKLKQDKENLSRELFTLKKKQRCTDSPGNLRSRRKASTTR